MGSHEREMADSLTGKTVLVTGGTRGIGRATVEAALAEGARVAFCARDAGRVAAVLASLPPDRSFGAVADVADRDAVERFVRAAESRLGPVEVLVNNAGVLDFGPFATMSFEAIATMIDVNLKGLAFVTRAVLPGMLARGRGVVVNVASGLGKH